MSLDCKTGIKLSMFSLTKLVGYLLKLFSKLLAEQITTSLQLFLVLSIKSLETNVCSYVRQDLLQNLSLVNAQFCWFPRGCLLPVRGSHQIIEYRSQSCLLTSPGEVLHQGPQPVAILCPGAEVEAGAQLGLDVGGRGGHLHLLVQLDVEAGGGRTELRERMTGEVGGDCWQLDVGDRVPGRHQLQPAAQLRGETVGGAVTEIILTIIDWQAGQCRLTSVIVWAASQS